MAVPKRVEIHPRKREDSTDKNEKIMLLQIENMRLRGALVSIGEDLAEAREIIEEVKTMVKAAFDPTKENIDKLVTYLRNNSWVNYTSTNMTNMDYHYFAKDILMVLRK